MAKSKIGNEEFDDYALRGHSHLGGDEPDPIEEAPDDQGEIVATAATIAVVAVGAAVFEAALLPGLALGVVAALAPRVMPNIGAAMARRSREVARSRPGLRSNSGNGKRRSKSVDGKSGADVRP